MKKWSFSKENIKLSPITRQNFLSQESTKSLALKRIYIKTVKNGNVENLIFS